MKGMLTEVGREQDGETDCFIASQSQRLLYAPLGVRLPRAYREQIAWDSQVAT